MADPDPDPDVAPGNPGEPAQRWARRRRAIIRDGLAIGIATGVYGLSFGAISTAAGLSVLQTCALSLLMFSGASEFALVALIGGGGNPFAGAATAVLLGSRNAFYGLRLSSLLGRPRARNLLAAHLVIDETTAMAVAGETDGEARVGFWATGVAVFALWNLGTLIGAVAAQAIPDPRTLGLDAAVPAAFLALLAPRMGPGRTWSVALLAAGVALAAVPFVPAGVPVLLAALLTIGLGLTRAPGEAG
ncbi:MAG: AzlC family ABC transporter permease [Actinomycetota bacterium]|nr:AzlC family ABC transporter permease [Actinomycetota bacterium]